MSKRVLVLLIPVMVMGCLSEEMAKSTPQSQSYDIYEVTSGCRVDTVTADWVDMNGPILGGGTSVMFHHDNTITYFATMPVTFRIIDSVRFARSGE